jgi:HTH-type transcriptional regulator/antitoxin MqsA
MAATEELLLDFMRRVEQRQAGELARIRRKLKLTQKQAAALTGGGHNAFSRYERGEARPLPAIMHLFRLLDRHPELLDELRGVRKSG